MRGSVLIAVTGGLLLVFGLWWMRPRETKFSGLVAEHSSIPPAIESGASRSKITVAPQKNIAPSPTDEAPPEKIREWSEQHWQKYGWVFASLGLSAPTVARLKILLVERDLSTNDAHDLAAQRHLRGSDQMDLVAITRDQVEREISDILDPTSAAFVRDMFSLELSGEFSTVVETYGPEFSSTGEPLTGQQALALANIMHRVNIPVAGTVRDQWIAKIPSIDPSTGLSGVDREIILEATPILSPLQITTLTTQLVKNTRRISEYIQERWPTGADPAKH
jgi:hypothetical protein